MASPASQALAVSGSLLRARIARRQVQQLGLGLEVRLAIRPAKVGQGIEGPAMADRTDDVLELAALGPGVVDIVGHDAGQAELLGQAGGLRDQPVVLGQEMVLELEDEAGRRGAAGSPTGGSPPGGPAAGGSPTGVASSPEQLGIPCGDPPGPLAIADPQPAGELAVATPGQGQETLGMIGQECLAEARNALGAGQVGPADQPAQAPVAGRIAGQQDQVWTARGITDPAQVLLDRLAPAGQPSPFRARSNRARPHRAWPAGPGRRCPIGALRAGPRGEPG